MKNKWGLLSLGPYHSFILSNTCLSLKFYVWRPGPRWLPIERVECHQSVLLCWAVLWPGGLWRHEKASLSLHRASGSGSKHRRKSCFHIAIVPLLIPKDVLLAEQQLKGLQEGAGIASCRSQEVGEIPKHAPGGLSLHKFNVQLED